MEASRPDKGVHLLFSGDPDGESLRILEEMAEARSVGSPAFPGANGGASVEAASAAGVAVRTPTNRAGVTLRFTADAGNSSPAACGASTSRLAGVPAKTPPSGPVAECCREVTFGHHRLCPWRRVGSSLCCPPCWHCWGGGSLHDGPGRVRSPCKDDRAGTPAGQPGPTTERYRGGQRHAGVRRGRALHRAHRALLNDPATAFGPIAAVLKSADFTAVNLETAVTSRGAPQPKTYHFRTGPAAFTALRDAGVSLVTMANNHVLDYGHAAWRTRWRRPGRPGSRTWGSARTPPPRGRRT